MTKRKTYKPRPIFGITSRGRIWASIAVPFLGGRYSRSLKIRRPRPVPGGQA